MFHNRKLNNRINSIRERALRSEANTFFSRNIRTAYHRLNSIQYIAPKILIQLPENIRTCGSLESFKQRIKK